MSHEKMSNFASFSCFWFILVVKLRNFDFDEILNTIFVKKYMTRDLNMSHRKMSAFVSFSFFGFKLVNFKFESHCNTYSLIVKQFN